MIHNSQLRTFLERWAESDRLELSETEFAERGVTPDSLAAFVELFSAFGLMHRSGDTIVLPGEACLWFLRECRFLALSAPVFDNWTGNEPTILWRRAIRELDAIRRTQTMFPTDAVRVQPTAFAAIVGQYGPHRYVLVDDAEDTWRRISLVGGKCARIDTGSSRGEWQDARVACVRELTEELGAGWRDLFNLELEPITTFPIEKLSERLGVFTRYTCSVFSPILPPTPIRQFLPNNGSRSAHVFWMPLENVRSDLGRNLLYDELFSETVDILEASRVTYNISAGDPYLRVRPT